MRKPDETFYLKWNNFQPNLAAGFQDLLQEETMVDVTIAVEGKYLQAHKIVLSVCSTYFKDLFKINPCRHPIVILKDIGYQEMSVMLHFMYNGEAAVLEKNLPAFLRLAEILKVRGLADSEENNNDVAESAKMNGKENGINSDSETETENGEENGEEEKAEESDDPPSSLDSIKILKNSFKSKVPESRKKPILEFNNNVTDDSNLSTPSEAPQRKKRKRYSVENSQVIEGPSTSFSQSFVVNNVKQETTKAETSRLTYNNDGSDSEFESSQPITNQEFVKEDSKLENNLEISDNLTQEPDFDISEFLNSDKDAAVLETLYTETDLRGKVISYEGFKYKFYLFDEDGTKLWRCTARYKKCLAELCVHPVLGVYTSKEHNHAQPKR